MHAKTILFDKKIVYTGSVNMTHNGMENNKEHLFRITETAAVADVLADFERDWTVAVPVTDEDMALMLKNDDQRKRNKNEKAKRAGGVTRSLTSELDAAQDEDK